MKMYLVPIILPNVFRQLNYQYIHYNKNRYGDTHSLPENKDSQIIDASNYSYSYKTYLTRLVFLIL